MVKRCKIKTSALLIVRHEKKDAKVSFFLVTSQSLASDSVLLLEKMCKHQARDC